MDVHWMCFDGSGDEEEECYEWDTVMDVVPRIGEEVQFTSEARGDRAGRIDDVTWYLPDGDGESVCAMVFAHTHSADDDPPVGPVPDSRGDEMAEDKDLLDAVESMNVERQSNGSWKVEDNLDPFPWTIQQTLRGAIADILAQRAARASCRPVEPPDDSR